MYGISFSRKEMVQMSMLLPRTNPVSQFIPSIASPVLGNILQQSKVNNDFIYIKIPGVPHEAVYAFVRFLYSSWYV
ncbi:hypothetical protein WN943_015972 [Citrus x changshan-huyou]